MNKNLFRKVQFTANIAIIVVAVFVVAAICKQILFPVPSAQESNQSSSSNLPNIVGKTVPLENVIWGETKKTMVLYLSNTCHFCTTSAPFYQNLVAQSSGKNIKLVAVLPQSVDDGRNYLKKLDVKIDNVYQQEFDSIGIRGTPTVLLVDEKGAVTNVWIGKLSKEKENQVLKELNNI
jgi:peroxiredoxin